ncbi:MAG TPA: hypothetical protein VIX19_15825 [Terriglobales bacterium]
MTAATKTAPPDLEERVGRHPQWIHRPWLDVLVGAGGWSLPLLLLAYPLTALGTQTAAGVFYALALFFNNPHYMATIYRAYRTPEERSKYRFFTFYATSFLVFVGILAHFYYPLLPWLLTVYITWSPWHYAGQNYGLLMMFVRRNGVSPAAGVRRALYGSFVASYLMLFLSFHARPSLDPLVLSLGLPEKLGQVGRISCGAAFAVLGAYALAKISKQAPLRSLVAPLVLFATQFLWFVLPSILELAYGVRLPQTRYSTGVLALMHSAQYLWITSYYARRESETKRPWRGRMYFATLVIGGVALFVPGPWLVSHLFHYDFSSSFLIFAALINIHHFILDGAIWKLRDGRIAAFLLSSRDRAALAAKKTGISIARRLSATSAARLRTAAAVVLILWATADQWRFHLAASERDLSGLVQVAALDPYDSTVEMRLAEGEQRAGDASESLQALRRAANMAGSNPELRKRFVAALLEAKLFKEAYANYLELRSAHAVDANWLVGFGLAAEQLGHTPEARQSWQAAVSADPRNALPSLCLAQSFERAGQPEKAIAYYDSYVRLVIAYPEANRPEPSEMSGILVESAHAHAQVGQSRLAMIQLSQAIRLATEQNNPSLEAAGYSAMAELQSGSGDVTGALRSYQSALNLDAHDPRGQAIDWFNYGQFLRDHKYPPSLAYACIRKAEELMRVTESPQLELVTRIRLEIEKELGRALSSAEHNREALAAQAAALSH